VSLSIGRLAARTGVSVPTLRMWEARHGFPVPERLAGGHRRYAESDVEILRAALRARESGLSLAAALDRARAAAAGSPASIYAGLRRERPDLRPTAFPKRTLTALAHAFEDEACSRAERPLLFGAFQRERFYRAAERRWREFAAAAELAIVFADFARPRRVPGEPVEVPVDRSEPLTREWSIVCDGPGFAACLAAWEVPEAVAQPDAQRRFEAIWTTEPDAVRAAALIAWRLARAALAELPETPDALARPPADPADAARRAADLANRMLAYVTA
jgi:MerR family transcriptional regulator, light-induced transcriptional regulator